MPRRTDIHSVMVIGSGPIVIGQACEFDYSGTQACRVLKAEGLRVILVKEGGNDLDKNGLKLVEAKQCPDPVISPLLG